MITRDEFMEFFRHEDFHSMISADDAQEIFLNVLHGSDDIKEDLLFELFRNYGVSFYLEEKR